MYVVRQLYGAIRKIRAYKGNNVINVALEDESIVMDNVVVTALGIKREKKGLFFSIQTVSGDDITKSMPSNWLLVLQGEVAGLNVILAGVLLSSTKISLRGDISRDMKRWRTETIEDLQELVDSLRKSVKSSA